MSNGLISATTSAIDVTPPGVATQLVVTSQPPSSVTAGSGFGLVVTAEDSFGTVDTSFNGSVTVNNPNDGSPLGETTAVNGVATFSDLILDQAGSYSLTVTSNGLAQATTNPFNVNPLAATQLMVFDPFVNVLPGLPFDLSVVVPRPYSGLMKANPWSRSPNCCMSVAKPFTTGSIDSNNGKIPTSVLVSLIRRGRGVLPPPLGIIDPLIAEIIDLDPGQFGYYATGWTVPLIQHHLKQVHGIEVCTRSISLALDRLRLRWKRPRHQLSRRPDTWRQAKGGSKTG